MEEYTFRKLDSSEFELLIPLMMDCFGMDVDINYFKWKYLDNPAGMFIGFIAVSSKNQIGAYYGVIPELYSIDGEIKTIYQSCDTMTHSLHRRKGLFQKLAKICYSYLEESDRLFIFGFGGAQSTPGFLKFGWVNPFSIRYYFFPKIFSTILKLTLRLKRNKKEFIRDVDTREIKKLLDKSNSTGIVHSVKTEQIFKWRISNPRHEYKITGCFNNNKEATGYICYYITDNKIFLFDYAFLTKKDGRALITELKKRILNEQLKGIVAFCQQKSHYSRMLTGLGFISNPFKKGPLSEKTPFIFFADKEKMDKYNDHSKWLINSFDHDAL